MASAATTRGRHTPSKYSGHGTMYRPERRWCLAGGTLHTRGRACLAAHPPDLRRRVVPPVFPWPLRALLLHRVQRSAHRLRTATSDPHARRQRIFGAVRWAVVGPGSADVSLHLTTEGNSSELFLGRDWLDRDLAAAGSHTHISQGTHHRRSELQQYAAAAGGNFPYPVCAATAVGG